MSSAVEQAGAFQPQGGSETRTRMGRLQDQLTAAGAPLGLSWSAVEHVGAALPQGESNTNPQMARLDEEKDILAIVVVWCYCTLMTVGLGNAVAYFGGRLTSRFLVRCALVYGAWHCFPGCFEDISRRFVLCRQGDDVHSTCFEVYALTCILAGFLAFPIRSACCRESPTPARRWTGSSSRTPPWESSRRRWPP